MKYLVRHWNGGLSAIELSRAGGGLGWTYVPGMTELMSMAEAELSLAATGMAVGTAVPDPRFPPMIAALTQPAWEIVEAG